MSPQGQQVTRFRATAPRLPAQSMHTTGAETFRLPLAGKLLPFFVFLVPFVVLAVASAAEPEPADPKQMLKVAERLLDEAERQHGVKQRMGSTVDSLARLVADLKSNELFQEGHGPRMDGSAKVLTGLKAENVPAAARYLEQARKQIEQLHPNLDAAESEIQVILRRLAELTAKADASAEEAMLNEIRLIIEKQQQVQNATRRWGRELIADPARAEPQREPLTADQKQINRGLDQFKQHLAEQAKQAADPDQQRKMARTAEAVESKQTSKKIDSAARNIETKKPVPAVQDQDKVLADLRELEEMLKNDNEPDVAAMKEARERLKDLLKKQTDLRQKTERTGEKEFPTEKKDLQVEQRKLGNELDETRKDDQTKDLPKDATEPLEQAQKEMDAAEGAMEKDKQDPATEAQKKAEENLSKAIKALDQEIADATGENQDEQADQPEQDALEQAAEAIKDLAEKQKALSEQTEKSKPEDIKDIKQPQQNLGQEAQQAAQQAPAAQQALQQAAQEMRQAAQQMQQAGQTPANAQQAQQQARQHQQAAEQALAKAAQQVQQAQAAQRLAEAAQQAQALAEAQRRMTEQTAKSDQQGMKELSPEQGELGEQAKELGEGNPEAGKQLNEAAGHMQQASQQMNQGNRQQAGQEQQAAQQALDQAAQQLAQAAQQQAGMAAYMPKALNPGERGSRDFGQERPEGSAVDKGKGRWTAMGPRERDALYQNYARELPVEYHQLLEDYYDALSK